MKQNFDPQCTYDLCVIGSGPAGIITTLEYALLNPHKQVLLVEYGSDGASAYNTLDKSITIDNLINHHPPDECTNKGFGGTSATWGGRCVMYDDVDFDEREIIKDNCTWESALLTEVKQHLPAAANYFECGEAIFNVNGIEGLQKKRIAENFVEGDVTDSAIERWSMPTRFGKRYLNEVNSRDNIILLKGYEARDFSKPRNDGHVSNLIVRKVNAEETKTIKAKAFVLAAGAQESTRILLRNKQLFNNEAAPPEALGKYYQSHLSGKIASVKFTGNPAKTDYGFIKDKGGIYLRRRFQFSRDLLVKKNLLNAAIWLDNPLYFDPKHQSGAMSFMYLAMLIPFLGKRLAPPAIAHSITKGKVQGLPRHLANILKGFPRSLTTPGFIFFKRYCLKRKLPGVFLYSPKNKYALHFHTEQIPVKDNLMQMAPDGETLEINYKLTDDDINSIISLHEILDDWLRKCNCGYLEYWFKKDEQKEAIRSMSKDGIHQSGTTRIASSIKDGVVDSNLKLFGTNNVFVCSSSVFPTSSQANPTFFMGAFAVRLARYLTKAHEKS